MLQPQSAESDERILYMVWYVVKQYGEQMTRTKKEPKKQISVLVPEEVLKAVREHTQESETQLIQRLLQADYERVRAERDGTAPIDPILRAKVEQILKDLGWSLPAPVASPTKTRKK